MFLERVEIVIMSFRCQSIQMCVFSIITLLFCSACASNGSFENIKNGQVTETSNSSAMSKQAELVPDGFEQATEEENNKQAELLKEAKKLLTDDHKPALAIEILDEIIEFSEDKYNKSDMKYYCSRSAKEDLLYMLMSATQSKSAMVVPITWADAYHMKGFALIDLHQIDAAREVLKKAVDLSPQNSYYLSELAFTYQKNGDHEKAMEIFKRAEIAARDFSPENVKISELTRALRGQAYSLIEMNRLDEAEKLYNECLKLNPEDKNSIRELKYIQQLRERASASSN